MDSASSPSMNGGGDSSKGEINNEPAATNFASSIHSGRLSGGGDGEQIIIPATRRDIRDEDELSRYEAERKLVRKIDWRLCTISGILLSLNLLDSGIISSASVTSIFEDLDLGVGNRYVSISDIVVLECKD